MTMGSRTRLTSFLQCMILAGLLHFSTCFKCFRCTSMLTANSTCDLSPHELEVIECDKYCFTELMTAADVHVYITRDCTRQFDCSEESTCRELAHSGTCKSCCRDDFCNRHTGKEVAANSMESMGVSIYCGNHQRVWITSTLLLIALWKIH